MKFRFSILLPILIAVMVLYEFATYGFTVDASVNKLLIGTVYGILLYILAYVIKTIVMETLRWLRRGSATRIL